MTIYTEAVEFIYTLRLVLRNQLTTTDLANCPLPRHGSAAGSPATE
jgi:hypothetical protein